MDVVRLIQKVMAPLQRRVRLMVGRGIINLVDDSLKEQGVQISLLADEVRDVERYQEYGFTSVPHPDCEAVCVFVGGNRDHGIIIATGDRRYRLKSLESGEVAIYTDEGDKVHLKRNNLIEIETETLLVKAGTKVRFETPLVEATGEIIDRCGTDGRSMDSMRTIYDSHVHPENDSGGPTDSPNQTMG